MKVNGRYYEISGIQNSHDELIFLSTSKISKEVNLREFVSQSDYKIEEMGVLKNNVNDFKEKNLNNTCIEVKMDYISTR